MNIKDSRVKYSRKIQVEDPENAIPCINSKVKTTSEFDLSFSTLHGIIKAIRGGGGGMVLPMSLWTLFFGVGEEGNLHGITLCLYIDYHALFILLNELFQGKCQKFSNTF